MTTSMNERTNTLLYKNIPLTLYSWKGLRKSWCWLCVRGELETRRDCHILTQSSSVHSSTSFSSWLGCSSVGHRGPKPSVCKLILILASCPPIDSTCYWNWTDSLTGWPKPSVAPCYIIVWHPPAFCGRTHTESNHIHKSRWYSDIFDRMHLFRCFSAYLLRCISWLTDRSRINILQLDN